MSGMMAIQPIHNPNIRLGKSFAQLDTIINTNSNKASADPLTNVRDAEGTYNTAHL